MDTPETQNAEQEWAVLAAQAKALDGEISPETQLIENPEAEPEIEISSGELMAQVIQVTADIAAPNWKIQQEESEQLGNVYGALLDKYLPDSGLNNFGLEISALLVTGMVLKSRAGIPLRKPESKKEEGEQDV